MDSLNYGTGTTQRLNQSGKEYNNPDNPKSSKLFDAWNGINVAINKVKKNIAKESQVIYF